MHPRSRKNRLRWFAATLMVVGGLIVYLFLPRGPRIEITAEDRSVEGERPRPGALFQGDGDPVVTFAEDTSTTDAVTPSAGAGRTTAGSIESVATVLGETGNLAATGAREAVLARLRRSEAQRLALARETAKRLGFPLRVVHPDGRVRELAGFVEGRPLYRETHNLNAAISTRADRLAIAPFSLTGTGVTVGVWDGGSVLANHQEFATGSRVTVQDGAAADDHATHVAGTIAATGLYAPARGMAPAARIDSYDWNDDALELIERGAASPTESEMIFLSNHSYGYLKGWVWMGGSGTPARNWEWWGSGSGPTASETAFGRYDESAQLGDAIAHAAPYFLMFWSAGNEGVDNPSPGDPVSLSPYGSSVVNYDPAIHPRGDGQHREGFETIGHLGLAKNVVTVGSVADAVADGGRSPTVAGLNEFSSTGPVDDGRIKPDLVANGDSLLSPIAQGTNWYAWSSGTSMSSPNAAGTAALVVQEYGTRFPGQAMRSSTLRGLLIHTADDLGTTGPDYRYGWGLVNGFAAAEQIRADADHPLQARIIENIVTSEETTRTHEFLWDGVSPIVATLCWTDPPSAPAGDDSRLPTLVNNLDLKILGPDDSEYLPWRMPFVGTWTTASLSEPAEQGLNDTDNVEQVRIGAPSLPGHYRCVVSFRGSLENGHQWYSIFVSGSASPEAPSVESPAATSITASGATLGGNVTADGGATITERGVVYSATATNNDPIISGTGVTKVTATGTTGVFTAPVTGLTQGTGYSYKAYATNSQGTTYSSVATFTSLSTNADLSALTLSSGTLNPTFASATTAYTASVSNGTTSITVTPTRAQANATIEARVNTGTYTAVTSGSPSAALSLNVGTNTVDVRVTAQDGTTQKTYTVTVTRDKAAQTITFANPGTQLANATVNLSAEGGASGEDVTFTVEGPATLVGNVLSFTGAGSVTVRANQKGNDLYHPAPEVAHTFTVTKASATVTLGNLSQTYDGTPKSATATTDPVGKTVNFTYEGSATAPTNAGSYAVEGTIDDPIYQGSAMGTLEIAKASQVITFANPGPQLANATVNLSAEGGASGEEVEFTVTSGPASISNGVLGFTGPGSVTVRASQTGNANYEDAVEVSHTFTVSKAPATLALSRLHQVADGTAREVVVTTVPEDLEITVTYDGDVDAPTTPGSYAVVATSADDRYEGSACGTFVVDDPALSVRVPGGGLPALSALGELTVPTFSIGAYEVTGSQWAAVVAWAEAEAGYDFDGAGSGAAGDRPVTGINWFDAAKWCNARTEWENTLLGKSLAPAYQVAGAVYKTGTPASPADLTCEFSAGGYRLPTAAEWEYAARGGASGVPSTYPGGNTLDDLGWYTANSNGAVQPAGGRTANGLGLYDLAGNAAEWIWDAPAGSPAQRLLRGGAWSSAASACELTALSGETPALRLDRSGFRLVRSISLALAAALDAPELNWESGGDEVWFAQTSPSHDEEDAAESGAVSAGQSSWLETTVTGPCNLRFRWEASQRAALDVFRLETGAGDPILLDGTGDWEEQLVELPAGDHTLRWVFARDAASTGTSRVRLDAVSVTTATLPTVTTAAASEVIGRGATLGGEVTADGGRTVTERGVVYSTSPQPTLTSPGVLTAATAGTGTFSVTATGLTEGTTYFARAYATNNLGTAYGAENILTTDTTVALTNGFGTVIDRSILAGDTQRFRFGLAFPSDAAFASTGLGAAAWELRDGSGVLIVSGTGNVDFGGLLLTGQYLLSLTSTGDDPQTFSLELDASIEAVPKPDLSIGFTASAATGAEVYSPTAQSVTVLSRRAVPKTVFARIGNDGLLPDAMQLRGSAGNHLFAVSYFSGGDNVTAQMIAGTFATAVMGPDDAPAGLSVNVTPNKRLITRKVKKGKRTVTTYLRKTYAGFIEARAAGNTALSDTVRYQVKTTP